MYVGVLKFQVACEGALGELWLKDAKSLCEKLRTRFKVVARACNGEQGDYAIVVTSLADGELVLEQLFDKVLAAAEAAGIGRVEEELVFIEDLDVLAEDEDDDLPRG